jgi:hypothetical protein
MAEEMQEEILTISNTPQWQSLRDNPVLLPYLKATVRSHQREWAEWGYDSDDVHSWIKNNSKALGVVGWVQEFIGRLENLNLIQEPEKKDAK